VVFTDEKRAAAKKTCDRDMVAVAALVSILLTPVASQARQWRDLS
jgi:hypothetical protein